MQSADRRVLLCDPSESGEVKMSNRFALFGAKDSNVTYVAESIGGKLHISLSRRESSFKGGEYYFHRSDAGWEISVEENVRDEEGYFTESAFSDCGTLVYVNYADADLEAVIAEISDLRVLRVEAI
jgi:hypothetical protein